MHKDERDDQSHAISRRLRERVDKIAARHGAVTKVVKVPPGSLPQAGYREVVAIRLLEAGLC